MEYAQTTGMEIAVIGMAGRFPGAPDLDVFWRNLIAGVEAISFFNEAEMRLAGVDEALLHDPHYVPARGILGDVDRFDAVFFGYSPKEAALMDPQQRIFLETAWKALEDAGYVGRRYDGHIGVFASVGFNSYLVLNLRVQPDFMQGEHGPQAMLSNDKDFLATRVSYKLNLTGPSVVVQSACSSSLVAVHQACQSLLAGEADMQMVGGVTVRVPEQTGHIHQEGMINSPDGHCRPFDKDAAGTVAGNGVGVVVLKRLEDALAEGDHIYAVIKATAVNNDGDAKVGYAAPSSHGQTQVIRAALALAEIAPDTLGMVEAHGSGTRMGDPIEVEALRNAYAVHTQRKQYCALGAVKANIGHLDAAAGIAGFIKTVLALHHGVIPPHPTFREANPLCDFANSPFFVNTNALAWQTPGHSRRAAVSSFGMGGTNAHVVLEQSPPRAPTGKAKPWQLVPLSAKTVKSIDRQKENLRVDLKRLSEEPLADIAYTLQTGRERFQHNYFLLARDAADALQALSMGHYPLSSTAMWEGVERRAVFMFSGQGAQYANMARALYEHARVFRAEFDACAEVLRRRHAWELHSVVFPQPGSEERSDEQLRDTRYTQPALFAVEYALAQQFMAWGIQPQALIGHSVGEYVAACVGGVMSRDDAVALVASRGELIAELPAGSMLCVFQREEMITPYLLPGIEVAVINAPEVVVIAGEPPAIQALQGTLEANGVKTKLLRTSHAFHSHMMEPILSRFRERLSTVPLSAPQIPVMSNLTGDWLTAEQATDPGYWVEHLRRPVRFAAGIERLAQSTATFFLEFGPGDGLTQFCRQTLGKSERHRVEATLPRPTGEQDALATAMMALGKLWQQGFTVDWSALHEGERRYRVSLATYPFSGSAYWANLEERTVLGRAASDQVELPFWTLGWRQALEPAPGVPAASALLVVHADKSHALRVLQQYAACYSRALFAYTGGNFAQRDDGTLTLRAGCEEDYASMLDKVSIDPQQTLDVIYIHYGIRTQPVVATHQLLVFLKTLARFASSRAGAIRLTLLVPQSFAVLGGERESWSGQIASNLASMLASLQPGIAWRVIDTGWLPDQRSATSWFKGAVTPLAAKSESTFSRWWRVTAHSMGLRTGNTRMFSAAALQQQLLSQDLAGFIPASVTAYRNGQGWRREIQPLALAQSLTPTRDGAYVISGMLDPLAAALLRSWHRLHGGHFLYLLPPPNPAFDVNLLAEMAQALKDDGLPIDVVRSGEPLALRAAVRRLASEHNVSLWHFNTQPAHREDELVIYFDKDSVEALTAGIEQQLASLARLPAKSRLWFSTVPAFLDHPPHALQIFPDAVVRVAGKAYGWRQVYLPPDFMAPASESVCAQVSEEQRMEWLTRIATQPATAPSVVLSGLAPQLLRWCGNNPDSITAQTEAEEIQGSAGRYQRPELPIPYAAPVTERQKIICGIWQELFQIDRVGIHDNFFDLGGDSVMALKLLSGLEIQFEVQLPLAEVMNSPTVAEQANSVVEYSEMPMDARRISPLVAFRKEGVQPPFFCIHPAGGLVHCYIELSRQAGKNVPFYGLQHPGLDGKAGPYTTYPKMAELYIEAMREVQPTGPYFLGGWSFGGTVAFDMARQLRQAGQQVGMLAMFDSPGPSALYRLQGRPEFEFAGMVAFLSEALARMFGGEVKIDVEELRKIPREEQMDYLVSRMVNATAADDLANAKQALERVVDIFELTDRAEQVYQPEPYDGEIYLYRVQEVADYEFTAYKNHPQLGSATFGWEQLCTNVVVRFVTGSHMNMIFPPHVEVVGEKFRTDFLELAAAARRRAMAAA